MMRGKSYELNLALDTKLLLNNNLQYWHYIKNGSRIPKNQYLDLVYGEKNLLEIKANDQQAFKNNLVCDIVEGILKKNSLLVQQEYRFANAETFAYQVNRKTVKGYGKLIVGEIIMVTKGYQRHTLLSIGARIIGNGEFQTVAVAKSCEFACFLLDERLVIHNSSNQQ